MARKELVGKINNYVVTFTIEGSFVTVKVYDTKSGETLEGVTHFTEDPRRLEEDAEMRKRFAETVVKMLEFFKELNKLIRNKIR